MSSRLWLAVRFGGKFPPPVIRFIRLEIPSHLPLAGC